MHVPIVFYVKPAKVFNEGINLDLCRHSILDPALASYPGVIFLNEPVQTKFGLITQLTLPSEELFVTDGRIVISDLYFAANKVVQMLYQARSVNGVITAVERFITEVMNSLFGKRGLINRDVLGVRITNSLSGVLLYDPDLTASQVAVSRKAARKAGISEYDIVLVKREPTLFKHSIIPMQVVFHNERSNVVFLPPQVFKGLGADCDGDVVYVLGINSNKLKAEAEREMLKQWWRELDTKGDEPELYGSTITLQDIRDGKENPLLLQRCKVQADLTKYSTGLEEKDFDDRVEEQVAAQVNMKVMLGVAGLLSQKLRIIAETAEEIKAANVTSEYISQSLLSAKHISPVFSIESISSVFDNLHKYSWSDILRWSEMIGLPAEAGIILEKIYNSFCGLTNLCKRISPIFSSTQQGMQQWIPFLSGQPEMNDIVGTISRTSATKTTIARLCNEISVELLGGHHAITSY